MADSDLAPIVRNESQNEERGVIKNRMLHSISDTEALIHLIKMNVGIGVMAMPTAFYNAGTTVGIAAMAFMAIVTVHCMHLLVNAGQVMTERTRSEFLDYAEVVDVTFHSVDLLRPMRKAAKTAINVFLCIAQIGGFAVYLLFIADNLRDTMNPLCGWSYSYRIYLTAIMLPTVLICSVRNLRFLSPISILANICEFYTLAVVFYYIFKEPLPPFNSLPMAATWEQLPIFFGTAMFTFEGIGIVLPLENKMKKPQGMKGWTGVLNTGMVFVACLYIAVGFFGYLRFGDAVAGKGSITLNLPPHEHLANSARVVISLAILLSNPLQFYVAISIIFPEVVAPRVPQNRHLLAEYLLRYGIILFCYGMALLVPDLDLFISLSGAICMSVLSLITPALLDMAVRRPDCPKWIVAKNWSIIIFGTCGSVFGTVLSIRDLINRHS